MPVSLTSNATTVGAWSRIGWPAVQPPVTAVDGELDAAMLGELERVRQQVLQHLLQTLAVRGDAAQRRIDLHVERQAAAFGLVAERPRHGLLQVGQQDLLGIHRHRAGFDLRQVENVADQVEQIGAGAVDRARELDLARRQVAVRIVAKLLAQDQNANSAACAARATCWRGTPTCTSTSAPVPPPVSSSARARLLDLLVLALHLDVLFGKLLRLLLQLLVGLLQLALLGLQFAGKLLRLLAADPRSASWPRSNSARCRCRR